ncbi:hypothetical protein [Palleronia caenipelagi]|uniref:FkbM family methyltransferase n=1 Tax=Palleronia caenipelagi TaxID=2489174 RepID=A0A547PHI3_9RHOB|nr:hypothetical protein [Palleronia caenipelagi]TRD13588.1 hypothetical protein FEV53_20195 [Palleronia caenipelagi]
MTRPTAHDPITRQVRQTVSDLIAGDPSPQHLRLALRTLAKWRCHVLTQQVLNRSGSRVQSGPFAGMIYDGPQSEGARIPRLLGYYEKTLVPYINLIISGGYEQVMDIGSAEGYYAVGMALRMPTARIMAYEIDPNARALLKRLVQSNGVSARVDLFDACTHDSFALCTQCKTAIICDIEGAEDTLLDPARAPGLRDADLLVETHPGSVRGVMSRLRERFAATHDVTVIGRHCDTESLPDWMEQLDDMDRMLALWEWRATPTPWLWMVRK